MSLDQAELGAVREVIRQELRLMVDELRSFAGVPVDAAYSGKQTELLDVAGVVALVPNTTAEAVCAWCRSGRLAAKKVGRGWVIRRAALDRFLSSLEAVQAGAPEPEREAARVLGNIRGSR